MVEDVGGSYILIMTKREYALWREMAIEKIGLKKVLRLEAIEAERESFPPVPSFEERPLKDRMRLKKINDEDREISEELRKATISYR